MVGKQVVMYRKRAGLTQAGLAARAGLASGYISQIERGERNVGRVGLVKLSQALGVTVDSLLIDMDLAPTPTPDPVAA